ncbi:MAG TPA: hypothetical protein ENN46_00420 [Candidatus Woesearchaeota archaeon]|nr:hypothetical protein [Candidatus Woesearchaeota archaeon]
MEEEKIIVMKVEKRSQVSVMLQQSLAKHGRLIEARLGLHRKNKGRDEGLVILCTKGKEKDIADLLKTLRKIDGIQVKSITM